MNLYRIFLIILMAAFIGSCSDDDIVEPEIPEQPAEVHTIYNLAADTGNTGEITYFRFSDSTVVSADEAVTVNWDIAFKGTTIYTNSGVSGPGQGGGLVMTGVDFSNVVEAPESGYAIDEEGSPAIPTGSGNGWYNYDPTTHIISPIPGVVLIIKTGEGNYAKVQILSYYKDMPENPTLGDESRFYTFKYFYQPDGSRKFDKS